MRNHAVDVGDLSCPARVENRACPGWALPVPLGRDAGVRGGGFWNPRTQQWGRGTGVESAGRTRGPQPCAWGQTDFTSRPASPGFGTWAGRSPGPSFLRGSHEVCETSHGGSGCSEPCGEPWWLPRAGQRGWPGAWSQMRRASEKTQESPGEDWKILEPQWNAPSAEKGWSRSEG